MPNLVKYNYNPNYTPLSPKDYNDVCIKTHNEAIEVDNLHSESISKSKYQFNSSSEIETNPILIKSLQKLETEWNSVYLVKFNDKIAYSPGDSIGLVVPNDDVSVLRLMKCCEIEDSYCTIERTGTDKFKYSGTIKNFLKYKFDLKSIPKKIYLKTLAKSAKKKDEMEYLCSKEGSMDYMRLGVNWNSIIDIIEEFECKPKLEDLVRYCEFIKPRYFSLINKSDDFAEILIGSITKNFGEIVKYGQVTDFIMNNFDINQELGYVIRRNKLFDSDFSKNLVSFCTGTGIAPFISFYRNKPADQQLTLVYGYRNDIDDLSRFFDLQCRIIRAKSSINKRVTDFVEILSEFGADFSVFICGNMKMQKSLFEKIKNNFGFLVENKKIFFDNWQ